MAGLKEIRRRIKSVGNTKKITYAMKLVSAAKLRKAQDALEESSDYSLALTDLLSQLALENADREFSHPLMQKHEEVKNVSILVVGGNKGLCGPFNSNINKKVTAVLKEKAETSPEININSLIMGSKPAEHFRRTELYYSKQYEELSQDLSLWPIDEISSELETDYVSGKTDELYILYTKFRSAISSEVVFEKLLPLEAKAEETDAETAGKTSGIILFEPSIDQVFAAAIPRIFSSRIRQAFLNSVAAEHGSRMSAMDSATTNAGELLDSLQLTHNKLRQSGITAELLDIIGGSVTAA